MDWMMQAFVCEALAEGARLLTPGVVVDATGWAESAFDVTG